MEISFDKQQKTQGVIKISVNRTDFQPGVDQKIKEYSKTANIKGFRPGKVPPAMIKKMYGSALIVDEINKLVSEKLNSYLRESDTQFLGEPLPVQKDELFDWDKQEIFEFAYEIGFAEPFEVKVEKVKMEKYAIKVDDSVINETIENLQRQFGEMENPEVASEKDTLYGSVKSKDGDIDTEISIDLRDVEKGSLKKMSGVKVGDEIELDPKKTFKNEVVLRNQLRMSEEDFKKLKGKLSFSVKAINHYALAPVDQDLFDKTFGKDMVKDEAGFRERVKEIVSQNYKGEEEQFFNYQIREKLTESSKIILPEEFLKKWLVQSSDQKITPELLDLEFNSYAKELKWSLIRNQLVKNQDIKVEHEDVMNEAKALIKRQFAGSGIGNQMDDQLDTFANNYLQGENGENYMKVFNQVQTNKVLDYIKSQMTMKDKTVSLDEFRKL